MGNGDEGGNSKKLSHTACLMRWCVLQEPDVLESCFWAVILVDILKFS